MAHNLVEAGPPAALNGERAPLLPLSGSFATAIVTGTEVQLGSGTFSIHLIPDADVKIGIWPTQAAAQGGTPWASCAANALREFKVTPGHWIKLA